MCVNVKETKKLIEEENPSIIFVDRSEGLYYEDFSWLKEYSNIYKIFDASQYFTQILLNKHKSPFSMGFDMIVSTLHKNYPGPQKGIIATQRDDMYWKMYINKSKSFYSNTHPLNIAKSILPYYNINWLEEYSATCLECDRLINKYLSEYEINIMLKDYNRDTTLHNWILFDNKQAAYNYFKTLEKLKIYTNYRILPYNLGFGIRIGVGAVGFHLMIIAI